MSGNGINASPITLAFDLGAVASDLESAGSAETRGSMPLGLSQAVISPQWRAFVRVLGQIFGNKVNLFNTWAGDIKFADSVRKERLDSLKAGLEQRFGADAAKEAFNVTKLDNMDVPLDTRTIKAARDVASAHALRAEGQNYANFVRLEVWAREGTKRLGHVGISVSHAIQQDGTLGTNKDKEWTSKEEQTYMSWFPSGTGTVAERIEGKSNQANAAVVAKAQKIVGVHTSPTVPVTSDSYTDDMIYEMSDRTRDRLLDNTMIPRSNQAKIQVKNAQGKEIETWGTHADSRLAVPLMGDNYSRKTSQTQFAYFGLSELGIRTTFASLIHEDVLPNLIFNAVSTDKNCAGRAKQLLEGAGAGALLPLPEATFLQDPNTMERYGRELMTVISDLNAKAAVVDQAFRPLSSIFPKEVEEDDGVHVPRIDVALKPVHALLEGDVKTLDENRSKLPVTANISFEERMIDGMRLPQSLVRKINVLADTDSSLFATLMPLRDALAVCGQSSSMDFESLTKLTTILVNAMYPYATMTSNSSTGPYLHEAHIALTALQKACNQACRMEKTPDAPVPSPVGADIGVENAVAEEADDD